ARQEDLASGDRRERGETIGEVEHRPRREVAEDVVRVEPLQLCGGCARDLGAAIADVRVPEARGAVEVAPAVRVPHVPAVAPVDDELVPVDRAHVGEAMPKIRHAREAIYRLDQTSIFVRTRRMTSSVKSVVP